MTSFARLYSTNVLIRYHEHSWLRSFARWMGLVADEVDKEFAITPTYTLDKMYGDIYDAFSIPIDHAIILTTLDGKAITSIKDLKDKEMYIVIRSCE